MTPSSPPSLLIHSAYATSATITKILSFSNVAPIKRIPPLRLLRRLVHIKDTWGPKPGGNLRSPNVRYNPGYTLHSDKPKMHIHVRAKCPDPHSIALAVRSVATGQFVGTSGQYFPRFACLEAVLGQEEMYSICLCPSGETEAVSFYACEIEIGPAVRGRSVDCRKRVTNANFVARFSHLCRESESQH